MARLLDRLRRKTNDTDTPSTAAQVTASPAQDSSPQREAPPHRLDTDHGHPDADLKLFGEMSVARAPRARAVNSAR